MGPSSCLCTGRSYHVAQKMSLASDSAHHRCSPGASHNSFEKQMGRLIPGLFFDALYYLITDWQYPGQRDFTVQNGAMVGAYHGLSSPASYQPMWSSGRSASDLQMLRTAEAILAPMNRHHYHHYYLLFHWYQKTITVVGLFTRVVVEGSWGAKGENSLFSTLSGCRAFLCSLFLGGHKREWQIMVSDVLESCQPLSV